jgi:hypothetical protein
MKMISDVIPTGFHLWAGLVLLTAAPAGAAGVVDFNRDVRPVLSDRCYACHGPDATSLKGDLRLDLREQATAPTPSGATAIVPGRPDQSELVRRLDAEDEDERMPPEDSHKSLSGEEKDMLRRWIAEGAVYKDHWSFLPPVSLELPPVDDAAWNVQVIDRMVHAVLSRNGLTPSPEADRATLIRRVSLDMRGLPPSLAEIDAYLGDTGVGAYERMVDAILASPQFGERMAMVWMDLARYGDTNGYHADSDRPVWLWRDWVIDAFNNNMPFDQFTTWQLGGDLFPDATDEQKIASGFNRNARFNEEGGADPDEFLAAYAGDRAVTMGRVWLGLTLNCAQCHTHKYDPISHKEYYQLTAFFNSMEEVGAGGVSGFHGKPVPPVMRAMTRPMKDELGEVTGLAAGVEREMETLLKSADAEYADPRLAGDLAASSADSQAAWEEELAVWQPPAAPVAAAGWDFTQGAAATSGGLGGSLEGGAVTTAEGLVLNGTSAHVLTLPLTADLRAKTLEAWVKLDTLTQRGGAVMTVQTTDPDSSHQVFDAIVFGEREEGRWMAGSDSFLRTEDLGGEPETEAVGTFVHLAIAYDEDGTIRFYRNGQAYGKPVKKPGPVTFKAGAARVVFGARALPPGGNFMLAGVLREARLHERALSEAEIAACANRVPPPAPPAVLAVIATAADRRSAEDKALLRDYYLRHGHAATVAALAAPRQRAADLNARVAFLRNEANHPLQMVSVELPQPKETFVLMRGDFQTPGEKVGRDVPAFLPPFPDDQPRNRLGLARWLMQPDQPLVARVQVNRFWQLLFGEGLVRTMGDFGLQGSFPTHPELLDWLALQFVESKWDVKQTFRLMLTSQTYRQASNDTRRHAATDPQNKWLWRAPRVRLQAETVRDNALSAAGLLSLKMGGPPVFPDQPADFYKGKNNGWQWNVSPGEDRHRRGLYTFWRRTTPYPTFVIFDAPDRAECTFERPRTNTPLQALATLNDPQFVEAARVLAQRLLVAEPADADARLTLAFRLVLARSPEPREREVLQEFLKTQTGVYAASPEAAAALSRAGQASRPDGLDPAVHATWTALANLILNLDETITRN